MCIVRLQRGVSSLRGLTDTIQTVKKEYLQRFLEWQTVAPIGTTRMSFGKDLARYF
jgi:hypothetical protein